MTKVVPTTQEQLIHFLLNNVQLGTYDKRFLTNIHAQVYHDKKPLTSNQATLLHKIVMRYQRQLAKKELNSHLLIQLPWVTKPTESLPQFTQAYVSIDDETNVIVVHSPYKTAFIKEIKNLEIAKWHKEVKEWTIGYCEEHLKNIVHLVLKHYDKVVLCDTITKILEEVERYPKDCIWEPTLVNCNGNLMIAASNEFLDSALPPLNNDLPNIVKIMTYGVKLGEGVIDPNYKHFDLIKSRRVDTTTSEIDNVLEFLKDIKCEKILLGDIFLGGYNVMVNFMNTIKESNIPVITIKDISPEDYVNNNYVLIKSSLINANVTDDLVKRATKIIGMSNAKLFQQ